MIESFTVAEHGEHTLVHPLEDHLETLRVAGTINGGRTENHCVHALGAVFVHQRLGIILGFLIVVSRLNGSVFVGGRIVHIAMHAAGGAVDEFLHLMGKRSFKHDLRAADIHLVIVTVRHVQLAERGGQVLHHLHAVHAAFHRSSVRDAADDHLCPPRTNFLRFQALLIIQADHLVAFIHQPFN